MCGLTGFYSSKKDLNCSSSLEQMLESISHRGKDYRGKHVYSSINDIGKLAMGHNRLSVLDLSENGNQPFFFKKFSIIYNGEIYNYEDLKVELVSFGYKFNSNSDTEVIIKLFDHFGMKAFEKLNGMFAIVIFDEEKGKVYLIRDRMGVKPLVYFQDNDSFLFSSEIKSFFSFPDFPKQIKINNKILANYFKYGYVNSFESIFKGVKKVENGTILSYDINSGKIVSNKYWELEKTGHSKINNITDAINKFYKILKSSTSLRLVSDIPVGLFLSSGIDSNLVLAFSLRNGLKKLDTYTLKSIDYEENNLEYDSRVIRKFINSNLKDIWNDYKFLCSKYDEPFADPATIGLYQLSKYASDLNKVIMVGDGGDELLAGYAPYKTFSKLNKSSRFKLLRFFYRFISPIVHLFLKYFFVYKISTRILYYHSILSSNDLDQIERIRSNYYDTFTSNLMNDVSDPLSNGFTKNSQLLNFLNNKTSSELIHQLNYKTDIAGMLNTVEIREPLLDYRLFEAQQNISGDLLTNMVSENKAKLLFREIMKKKLDFDLSKIEKKGFHISLEKSFRENTEELEQIIYTHNSSLINLDYVKSLWKKWKVNKISFVFIHRIVAFILWEKQLNIYQKKYIELQ